VGLDITTLLEIRTWRAFDVDDDGRVLAGFDETGSIQLVELTGPGEPPRPLTALPGACSGRYLPGERAVVVEHDDGGNERGQLSMLRLDGEPGDRPAFPVGLDGLEPLVRDSRYLHRLLDVLPGRVVYATNRRNGVDFDVVIRNVITGAEQVVYDGGGMAMSGRASADAHWVLVTLAGAAAMSDRLVLVDTMPETEGGHVVDLTADRPARHEGARWIGRRHAFTVASDADTDLTGIARYDLDGGAAAGWRQLVCPTEHDLACWPSPDGRLLLIEANDDSVSRLSLHDAESGQRLRDVELPADGVITFPQPDPVWSPNSRWLAISFTAPGFPGDVLLLDTTTGGRLVSLTSSSDQLPKDAVSIPVSYRVPTPDGELVPCHVYPSTAGQSNVEGSAVVVVHGGPEAQARPSFNPVVQAMTAAGHAVLVPNVRGSVGYGKRWYSADDVRKRLDSVADLAALHEWLPSLGLDPARVALLGGSYGGYMVLAGLAFQPERWAAGVDIVGISSLVTFLQNTSPYRRAAREREYGSLDADLQFLQDASPLSRVDAIIAPLFVIHGANDPRVPLSEAEQLVAAIREKGVECELLVYPDEGHGLAKRANRLDAYPKALAFLARHLEPGAAHARTP
jgi:protease II